MAGLIGALMLDSHRNIASTVIPLADKAAEQVDAAVAAKEAAVYDTERPALSLVDQPHPHIVPKSGSAVHPPATRFKFEGESYSIQPHVDSSVYHGAQASTRLLVQPAGESEAQWSQTYYRAFADDPAQKPALDDLARQLREIRSSAGLGSDEYLELIAKYVQSIPYDKTSFDSGKGRQRFPVETLVEGTGMCGDKSVLLAALLEHEDYAAALLDFAPEKHMAVGVRGPGNTFGDTGWLFLETTGPCYVTDVPDSYLGGVKLTSEPDVITIGTGSKQYDGARDVARIIQARDSADAAANSLAASAKRKLLTRSEANAINEKLNAAYRATVSLRSNAVDSKGRPVGTFMDREPAIKWVDRNVWWL